MTLDDMSYYDGENQNSTIQGRLIDISRWYGPLTRFQPIFLLFKYSYKYRRYRKCGATELKLKSRVKRRETLDRLGFSTGIVAYTDGDHYISNVVLSDLDVGEVYDIAKEYRYKPRRLEV